MYKSISARAYLHLEQEQQANAAPLDYPLADWQFSVVMCANIYIRVQGLCMQGCSVIHSSSGVITKTAFRK